VPLIYEEFVPFEYEVSIIGVRGRRGDIRIYPLNRNYHADGILRLTLAPWHAPALLRAATQSLRRVLEAFSYVGVLAIEFFVRRGRLVANEMAPRVHNSGHWTLEAHAPVSSRTTYAPSLVCRWAIPGSGSRRHDQSDR